MNILVVTAIGYMLSAAPLPSAQSAARMVGAPVSEAPFHMEHPDAGVRAHLLLVHGLDGGHWQISPREREQGSDWRIVGTDGSGARLREGPSTQASVLASLPEGSSVESVGGPLENDGINWIQVRTPAGQLGWVAAQLLEAGDGSAPAAASSTAGGNQTSAADSAVIYVIGATDGQRANMREAPSISAAVVESLDEGVFVEPLDETATADDYTWRKIRANGRVGWVISVVVRQR